MLYLKYDTSCVTVYVDFSSKLKSSYFLLDHSLGARYISSAYNYDLKRTNIAGVMPVAVTVQVQAMDGEEGGARHKDGEASCNKQGVETRALSLGYMQPHGIMYSHLTL